MRAEALPFLRTMFVFSIGMLMFFMLGGALRSAGDARTPLRLGIAMTVLNIALQRRADPGLGPDSGVRHARRGDRHVDRERRWSRRRRSGCCSRGRLGGSLPARHVVAPDWSIIRSLFRFGLPAGVQGIAMNIAGVLLLRFIGSLEHSAEAQAAYAVGYTELFSLITWTSVGLMGAAAAVAGQNLGAGNPERAMRACTSRRGSASAWRRASARCSC